MGRYDPSLLDEAAVESDQADQTQAAGGAPSMSQAEAALHGYRTGASANFSDEIYGLSKASGLPDWMGGFRAPVGAARMLYGQAAGEDPEFMRQYREATAQRRAEQKAAEEQYPGTYLGGQVAGSLLVPGGAAARGATLPARIGRGAAFGAGYGGASGLGAGENDLERLQGGAMGGVLGGVTGGVAPAAVEGVLTTGGTLLGPLARGVRGAINPEGEAARHVANTLGADVRTDAAARTRLTPQEFAGNVAQGGPATVMDLGGEATRGLARAAANASPDARTILNNAIEPRFETQSNRVADWLRHNLGYPNAVTQEQALAVAARGANNPAYARAYAAGAGNVGSTELERLASSDAVAGAMRAAAAKANDEAVISGHGAMNPRVTFGPGGQVIFQRSPSGMPTYPDLQFWDLTRRELSDAARRAGPGTNEARRLNSFAGALNTELDRLVPEYQQARQGAAHFFGGQNALEAGQNFLGQGEKIGVERARQAKAAMTPLEQRLFEDAYGSSLINKIEGTNRRHNIVNKFATSEGGNAELNIGLGAPLANDLRQVRRVEDIMDRPRQAMGNSTTARQLIEQNLLTGAGVAGAGLGAHGIYQQDPTQMALGGAATALATGGRIVNQNVMRQVAEILTSQDPTRIARDRITRQLTAQNPAAIRAVTDQALATAATRSHASEQRSAMARYLLERGIIGGVVAKGSPALANFLR